jgi:hypothetical protein
MEEYHIPKKMFRYEARGKGKCRKMQNEMKD